jgi:hypothetical protein
MNRSMPSSSDAPAIPELEKAYPHTWPVSGSALANYPARCNPLFADIDSAIEAVGYA